MKTNTAKLKRLDILGNGDHPSDREIFAAVLKRWRQRLGYCSIFAAVPAMVISQVQAARTEEAKQTESSVAGQRTKLLKRLSKNYSNPALLKRQSKFVLPHQKGSFDLLAAVAGNDDCPGRTIPEGNYTFAAPYIDSGNTTGANNTVGSLASYYYYGNYDASGPDHVYSFTLTGHGPNAEIEVSTTSGTYRPLIYVLEGESTGACPAGTGNHASNWWNIFDSRWTTGSTATLGIQHLPLNVPLHLFVDSAFNDAAGAGPYTIRMQDITIAPPPVSNPIDDAQLFVSQHYFDFLNRDPDAGGLAYWTNRIAQCGSNATCIHERRIGVSAAFFIELEFQDTGYYVYRFYKASLGRQPNYADFTSDRSKVVDGSSLEANKQAFADEWVQRPAFLQAYPNTLSNTEFVNKLFDTAGLTASIYDPQRQQEIAGLNSGRSRALVLRDVIEIPDFKNVPDPNGSRYAAVKQVSQYNPAFVLMQYFGYLRRNIDQNGYDFWLDVLNNRAPNNYNAMVCAFLTSAEYQLRFGTGVTRTNQDCGP